MVTGKPYTELELQRALALRARGLSWRIVAMRLGRPKSGLTVTVGNYRKGLWAPAQMRVRSAETDRKIEAIVSGGTTSIREIADRLGISPPAVCRRLGYLGLDREMRIELAESSYVEGIAA